MLSVPFYSAVLLLILPTCSCVAQVLAGAPALLAEATRTDKINDLVNYLLGEEDETQEPPPPPSAPWEWDRVGHDTCTGLAKDCGAQTMTRYIERVTKGKLGSGAFYCELLKQPHKAALKEYRECRALVNSGRLSFNGCGQAAKVVLNSPNWYVIRGFTGYLMDIAMDAVAWYRGQMSTEKLSANAALKLAKHSLFVGFSLVLGLFVPFLYPHPFLFPVVEQLAAMPVIETIVGKYGAIEPH